MWHTADLGFACGPNLFFLFADLKLSDTFSPYRTQSFFLFADLKLSDTFSSYKFCIACNALVQILLISGMNLNIC
jgi:hypothetical protein